MMVNNPADAMILSRLFEQLLERGVKIVTTSNRPPRDLYKDGLNRELFLPFIDLIEQRMEVVAVNGPTDYRLDRLAGVEAWHVPNGPEATAALSEAFFKLTDYPVEDRANVPTEELDVGGGRTLHVPKSLKGVAVFSFKRLCGEARGAADYLAIAQPLPHRDHRRHSGDDPRHAQRGGAVRHLIDALYEHRVKLLAAADAEPAGLYPAGDGSFEFARTVSRLEEMQSAEYLAEGHGAARLTASQATSVRKLEETIDAPTCPAACLPLRPAARRARSADRPDQARAGVAGQDPRRVQAGDRDSDGPQSRRNAADGEAARRPVHAPPAFPKPTSTSCPTRRCRATRRWR